MVKKVKAPVKENVYDADSMRTLKGLQVIKERPQIYGSDRLWLFKEVIDNSCDELANGHGSTIDVIIDYSTQFIEIADDGRGIPTGFNKEEGLTGVEMALCVVNSGGKMDAGSNYGFSSGLNGIGSSATNALSEVLQCVVLQNGEEHFYEFNEGEKQTHEISELPADEKDLTGTIIRYKLGEKFAKECSDDEGVLPPLEDMQEMCLDRGRLLPDNCSINFTIIDAEGVEVSTTKYAGTVEDFVKGGVQLISRKSEGDIGKEGNGHQSALYLAVKPAKTHVATHVSFTNQNRTRDHGTYMTGVKTTLVTCIKQIIADNKTDLTRALNASTLSEITTKMTSDMALKNFHVLIVFDVKVPLFHGNAKSQLKNKEARGIYSELTKDIMGTMFNMGNAACKSMFIDLLKQISAEIRAEAAVKKITASALAPPKDNESNWSQFHQRKLKPNQNTDPSKSVLVICEGDSASGSIEDGRDADTIACFPVRGKLTNCIKTNNLSSELQDLILALRCGSGDKFDIDKLRYHHIVIISDGDIDGLHITSLVLTFFYVHYPELIEAGHIYYSLPPLYMIKIGRETHYLQEAGMKKAAWDNFAKQGYKFNSEKSFAKNRELVIQSLVDVSEALRLVPIDHDLVEDICITALEEGISTEEFDNSKVFGNILDNTPSLSNHTITEYDDYFECHGRNVFYIAKSGFLNEVFSKYFAVWIMMGEYGQISISGKNGDIDLAIHEMGSFYATNSVKGMTVTRFKGLGEMNSDELATSTLDWANNSNTYQIGLDDLEETENDVMLCMSDKFVAQRKQDFADLFSNS